MLYITPKGETYLRQAHDKLKLAYDRAKDTYDQRRAVKKPVYYPVELQARANILSDLKEQPLTVDAYIARAYKANDQWTTKWPKRWKILAARLQRIILDLVRLGYLDDH